MFDDADRSASADTHGMQRLLLEHLLRDDHREPWARAQLERELSYIPPLAVNDAIAELAERGLAEVSGEQVRASAAAHRRRAPD